MSGPYREEDSMKQTHTVNIDFENGGPTLGPWEIVAAELDTIEFKVAPRDNFKRFGVFFKDPSHKFFEGGTSSRVDYLPDDPLPPLVTLVGSVPSFRLSSGESVTCSYGVYVVRSDGKKFEIDPDIIVRR
jgi:hypothetical protein